VKKGKNDVYKLPFVALGKDMIFKCPEWKQLSPAAREIYIMLKAKYNRKNNGSIQLYYSEMQKFKGRANSRSIFKGFQELESGGWIECAEKGGLYRKPNKYRLTGKFDGHL